MSAKSDWSEELALELDQDDPLREFRPRFAHPRRSDGTPWVYFVGNSLGLMPLAAREAVIQELDDWAALGVEGHFEAATPWYSYHEVFQDSGARLVGARPGEVVMMNSLTVNLHLMLATFYQPAGRRTAIAIEPHAFPSDLYALESHLRHRGRDPERDLRVLPATPGEATLSSADIESWIARHGEEVAVLLLSGVNYYSGQLFEIERITRAARARGCVVGWDLAHAAGNVPLALHDWDVDFAVWCSYKYLNAGPGAIAGCFVHERHGANPDLPRLAGWWGNDPATRFRMHENRRFHPQPGAPGWQVSNPPIFAMAPLRASLDIFDAAGMDRLRAKSLAMTRFLDPRVRAIGGPVEVLTPQEPDQRGCQLSLRFRSGAREVFDRLTAAGFLGDFRHPDVIRIAPVPLYNSFHEIWRFGEALEQIVRGRTP